MKIFWNNKFFNPPWMLWNGRTASGKIVGKVNFRIYQIAHRVLTLQTDGINSFNSLKFFGSYQITNTEIQTYKHKYNKSLTEASLYKLMESISGNFCQKRFPTLKILVKWVLVKIQAEKNSKYCWEWLSF